ncbi:MAG TPA: V-type ATP synthase subunit I, partial [Dielma fastidiosa]|nr:V-type ATP synthase subunit I [Dielma fastidiosa]
MAITKMRLMNIITDKQHLEEMLLRFSTLDNFHPELANKIVDRVSGLAVLNDANPYADLLSKVSELCAEMDLTFVKKPIDSYFINLDETNKMINEIKAKFDQIHEIKKELQTVIEENKMAVIQVKNVSAMNINFDDLFSCRYLKIRVGRMPKQSVDKLQYYNNRPYIFKEFNKDEHFCWCMYITTMRYEGEVDNIFSSLHFERVRIPDFVHGTPEGAIKELEEDMKQDQEHLDHVIETEKKFVEESAERLSELYTKLQCLNQTYEVQKYVVLLGERASISGFVSEEDVERVKQQFADIANVEVEVRPAHSDSRLMPPTKLKNNWFVRPFEMFVEMYGMPCYEDFDPTPFVALTYCLLFGIMFADVGQGLVLSFVGYIAYKKMNMRL